MESCQTIQEAATMAFNRLDDLNPRILDEGFTINDTKISEE